MGAVQQAVQLVLAGHDPYPAIAIDHGWALVARNRGAELLLAGLPDHLLAPPANVLRASLHPEGLAPRILNLAQWRTHLLERLDRQAALTGDPSLKTLYDELAGYPAPPAAEQQLDSVPANDVVVPLRIAVGELRLSFFSTVTTFGTPVDITVEELSLESFFPADRHTTDVLQAHAG